MEDEIKKRNRKRAEIRALKEFPRLLKTEFGGRVEMENNPNANRMIIIDPYYAGQEDSRGT